MHRLHKVNKSSASALAFRRITWSILNFVAFAGLSLWVAFRRVSNVISRRLRPPPVYTRLPK
ncbi:MAG TPA: hypothetical protein VFA77_15750 [Candidatus Eisenbacteria bacterium]|nr:hypothetical protein [Candidatus Eisenbacteria bacterium]